MQSLRERRALRTLIVLASCLLLGLALFLRAQRRASHEALDERQASVLAIRSLQRTCERGERPAEAELVAVARLFPDASLTCAKVGEVVSLVFEREPEVAATGPIVMQVR